MSGLTGTISGTAWRTVPRREGGDFSFARCRSAALRLKIKTIDRLYYSGQFSARNRKCFSMQRDDFSNAGEIGNVLRTSGSENYGILRDGLSLDETAHVEFNLFEMAVGCHVLNI